MVQQKVKNEHYVPQRYLHTFAKQKGKTYRFNIFDKEKIQIRPGNVEDYASERYFYDVDFEQLRKKAEEKDPNFKIDPEMEKLMQEIDTQHIEHFFAENVETFLFDSVAQITSTYMMANPVRLLEMEILNDEQIDKISLYLALQQVRTKEFRQVIIETYERMPLLLMKKMAKSEEERELLNNIRLEWNDENQKKLLHAQMILDEDNITKLALVFRDKYWMVLINETGMPFYTSDNPVVRYGHCGQMGYGSRGIEIAFPINSRLILVLRDRDYFSTDGVLHKHFCKIDEENVIFYNALQVQQSYRYVFCKEEKFDLANDILKKEPELSDINRNRFFMC